MKSDEFDDSQETQKALFSSNPNPNPDPISRSVDMMSDEFDDGQETQKALFSSDPNPNPNPISRSGNMKSDEFDDGQETQKALFSSNPNTNPNPISRSGYVNSAELTESRKSKVKKICDMPMPWLAMMLLKLPMKQIIEVKGLSSFWRTVVENEIPAFLTNSFNYPESGNLNFLLQTDPEKLFICESEKLDWSETTPLRRRQVDTPLYRFSLLGSCNGLACLYGLNAHSGPGPAAVFNPLTNESIILPGFGAGFGAHCHVSQMGYGFGYAGGKYKVVRLFKLDGDPQVHVEVYTLGDVHGWRRKGPHCIKIASIDGYDGFVAASGSGRASEVVIDFETLVPTAVYWRGALYWRMIHRGRLVSFDLKTEKFATNYGRPNILNYSCFEDSDYNQSFIGVSANDIFYYVVSNIKVQILRVYILNGETNRFHLFPEVSNHDRLLTTTHDFKYVRVNGDFILELFRDNAWRNLLAGTEVLATVCPYEYKFPSIKLLAEEDGGNGMEAE